VPSLSFGLNLGFTGSCSEVPKLFQKLNTPRVGKNLVDVGVGVVAPDRLEAETAACAAVRLPTTPIAALAAGPDEDEAPGDGAAGSRETVFFGGDALRVDLRSEPVEPLKDGAHPCC